MNYSTIVLILAFILCQFSEAKELSAGTNEVVQAETKDAPLFSSTDSHFSKFAPLRLA